MKALLDLNTHSGRLPWLLVVLGLNHVNGWVGGLEVLGYGLVLVGASMLMDKLK